MKRSILIVVFLSSMASLTSQTTMLQRKQISGKIDTLLLNYINYAKLTSTDDLAFSEITAKRFSYLFIEEAEINDEVNPGYYDKNYDNPFSLPTRKMEDYITKTRENYPWGLKLKYQALYVDYNSFTAIMQKETKGINKDGLIYVINDTIRLKFSLSNQSKVVRIEKIEVLGYVINCLNDDDRDFIPNEIDKCPQEQGLRTETGCFTKEERMAVLAYQKEKSKLENNNQNDNVSGEKNKGHIWQNKSLPTRFFLGLNASTGVITTILNFDINNLNYLNQIAGNPKIFSCSGFTQDQNTTHSQYQLDIDYFFGRKAKIGLATGFGVTNTKQIFTMHNFHIEYQSTDSKGRIYRRLSTVQNAEEETTTQSLTIPILAQYKLSISKNVAVTLGLGTNILKIYSCAVNAKALGNDEGIYNFDNNQQSIFDGGLTPSNSSWIITKEHVEIHNGNGQMQEYFAQKAADGYGVGINEQLANNGQLKLIANPGFLSGLNLEIALSEKTSLTLLTRYQRYSIRNLSSVIGYRVSDEIGSYNMLMKNVSLLKTTSLVVGVGLKFTLK